jgi:hypothetical protein
MQTVELRSHCNPKRKISLQCLSDQTALVMIIGAKFYQHRMIR